METVESLEPKGEWKIGKLTPEQRRNARSRSVERRRPESRMLVDQEKKRLSIGNARNLTSLQEYPLRPIEDDQRQKVSTESPGTAIEDVQRDMKEMTDDVRNNEKILADRILENERKTIELHQYLENVTGTANALTDALQKALGQITHQQELHQNNLTQHEDCLLRSRNLLAEQQQFNAVIQQKSIATQQRMDQYEAVMEELTQDSRLIHESIAQQCRQGMRNQETQGNHEAETMRLREELSQMKLENARRRERDGDKTPMNPLPVVLENLVPPPAGRLPVAQPNANLMECEGHGPSTNSEVRVQSSSSTVMDSQNWRDPPTPAQPNTMCPPAVTTLNQPIFVPILSQESCPAFTPAMYSNWRREIKLWLSTQHGMPTTHILARIIAVLPLQSRIEAMNYMDSTETKIHTRSLDPIWAILDNRYGKTDAERSCAWLTAFTDFRRESQENYKDFWTRFTRCTTKLQALGMPLSDTVIFNKALTALRIPDGQLPVILSAMETRTNPKSTEALRQMTIRMYETHKKSDSSDVYQAQNHEGTVNNVAEEEESEAEFEWTDEFGEIFLMKPKRKGKPKNAPGNHETAKRGAIDAFRSKPNSKGAPSLTTGGCIRCGDPNHHWKDCPHPFVAKLNPQFQPKGKGRTFINQLGGSEEEGKGGDKDMGLTASCISVAPADSDACSGNIKPDSRMTHLSDSIPEPIVGKNNDAMWAEFYGGAEVMPTTQTIFTVCDGVWHAGSSVFECAKAAKWFEKNTRRDPLIIIDSGASQSVVGKAWLLHHQIHVPSHWSKSTNSFRFGSGPAYESCGFAYLRITIPGNATQSGNAMEINIQADVVDTPVPFLISMKTLQSLEARIDFRQHIVDIPSRGRIKCEYSSSGHLLLPGRVESRRKPSEDIFAGTSESQTERESNSNEPEQQNVDGNGDVDLDAKQLCKLHRQMGHCSKASLLKLLKTSKRKFLQSHLDQVYNKCKCQHTVDRITPPLVSSIMARRAGEIVAVDICYPFARIDVERQEEIHHYDAGTNYHSRLAALIMVCALTRFTVCSLLSNLSADCVAVTFVNDWVRFLGKPRRIISDRGGPGFTGNAWNSLSNIFGWQDVRAPAGAAYQNGLCERSVRQIKIAVRTIMVAERSTKPTQLILTWATIAKNHVPHATTGIPPAYAMTGRCDILAGYGSTAWQPDRNSDSLMLGQTNPLVQIMQARNAIMTADANNRIDRCIDRNLRDRAQEPFIIGQTVQLAIGKAWVGSWRVVAVTTGNIIVEKGMKLVKWPKCKARIIHDDTLEPFDSVLIPEGHEEIPAVLSDSSEKAIESDIDLPSDIEPELDVEDENMDSKTARSSRDIGVVIPKHQASRRTYATHESLICAVCPISCPSDLIDRAFCMDAAMENQNEWMEVVGSKSPVGAETIAIWVTNPSNATTLPDAYTDDEVTHRFDPSRLPPRVAFRIDAARKAIETEITDLLATKPGTTPAMLEISLNDSRFRHLPRVQSTMIVKRKAVNHYKGSLCVRGDMIPLLDVGFISSPTVHRCGVKLLLSIATQCQWKIHSVDVSQAFLQSESLSESQRLVVVPPPYVQLPWAGHLAAKDRDMKSLPSHSRGFLLLKPLYGGRDAPMRWFLTLSKRLRSVNFRQLKMDVCIFSRLSTDDSLLEGLLIIHVDDIMITGTSKFIQDAVRIISTFKIGEVEELSVSHEITYLGLQLRMTKDGSVYLSQCAYINDLMQMDIKEYLSKDKIVAPQLLKSTFRQGLGTMIWIHQTRPDVGFIITQLATTLVESCMDASKARRWMQQYNKLVRFTQSHNRAIAYIPLNHNLPPREKVRAFMKRRIITFTDAGFGSLSENHSVESSMTVLGELLSRDGTIECHGVLLDHRCAKIHRVCRSSLNAESHAAVTAADTAIWFQILLLELTTHEFHLSHISPPSTFPLPDPFEKPPSTEELKKFVDPFLNMSSSNHVLKVDSGEEEYFISHCHHCQTSENIYVTEYHKCPRNPSTESPATGVLLFRPILLTDCCSLFSAILNLQPKSVEKCGKIILNHLRDMKSLITISFIDATCNLADIATKHASNLPILDRFFTRCRFTISFLGRKDRKV